MNEFDYIVVGAGSAGCVLANRLSENLANSYYNGASQEGVGCFQQTAYQGFRWSTAKSFLRPAKNRPILKVLTRAQAQHRMGLCAISRLVRITA